MQLQRSNVAASTPSLPRPQYIRLKRVIYAHRSYRSCYLILPGRRVPPAVTAVASERLYAAPSRCSSVNINLFLLTTSSFSRIISCNFSFFRFNFYILPSRVFLRSRSLVLVLYFAPGNLCNNCEISICTLDEKRLMLIS